MSVLMYKLKQLKKKYGLSLLILAHTPKRNLHNPLTQNDLAGSKKLFNFTDSVFAIGQSVKDRNIQYLKQLKSRGGEIEYGEENVILMERSFSGNYLHFETVGYDSERNHLKEGKIEEYTRLKEEVAKLQAEGMSQREIGRYLKISTGKVNKVLNG